MSLADNELIKHNKLFEDANNFFILGKKGSGKSALAYLFLERSHYSGKKCYVYNPPNEQTLELLPFPVNVLHNLTQLENLENACILIDEAQVHFSSLEKKVNNRLRNILSTSRHKNISFILIAHNGYFINRSLFSYIDVRIIKQVNEGHFELERPFFKKLYENVSIVDKETFYIDSDEIKGYQKFKLPIWYTDAISKQYCLNKNPIIWSSISSVQIIDNQVKIKGSGANV